MDRLGTGRICIIWFRLTKQNLTSGRIFINLQDVNGMDHTPFATVVDVVCAPFFRPEIPKQTLNLFVKMSFAGRYDCGSMVKVTFDWFRCVLVVCFTRVGKLWHCRHDDPGHSVWLDGVWLYAFMAHRYGSQCISSVIAFNVTDGVIKSF